MTVTLTAPVGAMTPLELHNGRWYKRDDLLRFSNGVNGKIRTSLYLAELAWASGAERLVYGGSVHAPALGRVASAAAYTGLQCTLVVGSDPDKAVRHDTVRVAVEAGAELVRSKVAYNPALQKLAASLAGPTCWQVPYGVSTPADWSPGKVTKFLERDAPQVDALAASGADTLVLPFGSGNAASGVLYGLATRGHGSLRHIKLMGIGPDRWAWLRARLDYVGVTLPRAIEIELLPLHPHFAQYADRMPETRDGIAFHPTYEGKVVRYLDVLEPDWWTARDGRTCLWIVGGPL